MDIDEVLQAGINRDGIAAIAILDSSIILKV